MSCSVPCASPNSQHCPFPCLSAPVDEVKLSILLKEDVESGKAVVLRCSVNEASGPITFSFYREKETRPFHQTTLNETQAIWHNSKASKEHEGRYYCTAFNRANHVKSTPQSNILTVRGESGSQTGGPSVTSKGETKASPLVRGGGPLFSSFH